MWTKKIEIKDQNHLKEVVEALKSMGEEVSHIHIDDNSYQIKSLWYVDKWYYSYYSIYSNHCVDRKHVPEYEIITKTSYELKEVQKSKITCKNCGKTVEYKDYNDVFKYFVFFKGLIITGDKTFSVSNFEYICKDCIKKLINN